MGKASSKGTPQAKPPAAANSSSPRQQPSADLSAGQSANERIKILLLGDTGSGKSRVFSILGRTETASPPADLVASIISTAYSSLLGLAGPVNFDLMRSDQRETLRKQWREKVSSIGLETAYSRFATAQYLVDCLERDPLVFTADDGRHIYVRTTGIIEAQVTALKRGPCVAIDVGGRRNERKKWIHTFVGVSVLVVCVSLMSVSAELANADGDNECDGMALWKEVAHSQWFRATPRVLIFTHYDSLVAELKMRPFARRWPNCPHTTPRRCTEWLVEEYRKLSADVGPTPAIICGLATPEHDAKLIEAIDIAAEGGQMATTMWVTSPPVWPFMRVFLAATHKQRGDSSCPAASLPLDVYKYMLPFFRSVVSGATLYTDGVYASIPSVTPSKAESPPQPTLLPMHIRSRNPMHFD